MVRWLDEEAAHGRFFLWAPVALAAGSLLYFALPAEPASVVPGGALLVASVAAFALRRSAVAGILLTGAALVAGGAMTATLRTKFVTQPVLWEKHGPVELDGQLLRVERRRRGVRLTIATTSVPGLTSGSLPARVRVTWRGGRRLPEPGSRILARVVLLPPPGPVAPGAYHYGRALFFQGIGATGYVIGRPAFFEGTGGSLRRRLGTAIEDFRHAVTARIGAALPGENGAIAAALLSGERGEIPEATNEALRTAGLAHILSISGLHMSLFAVVLYTLVRTVLAAVPGLALRRPIRAWAAGAGLAGAAFYLVLSGGGVPAERSWIMVSIMFLALIAGRRALTMRNVALAALAILVLEPESVLSASFQMSFAATVALIAAYETAAGRFLVGRPQRTYLLPLRYVAGLAATSLVAGSATGIFAAFHFHTIATYGLIGNLLAMPIMGMIVMPAGMLGLALMPLGLEGVPLAVMGLGLDGVTGLARMVSGWPGAVARTHGLTATAVLLACSCGLWVCLWRSRWRWAGLGLLPLILLAGSPLQPDLLVEADGRTIAMRGPDGHLVVAGLRRGRFAAGRWLEADADRRSLSDPSLKDGFVCNKLECRGMMRGGRVVVLVRARSAMERACREATVLVSALTAPRNCGAPTVIDGSALAAGGAHALRWDGTRLVIRTSLAPGRPWDRRALHALAEQHRRAGSSADD